MGTFTQLKADLLLAGPTPGAVPTPAAIQPPEDLFGPVNTLLGWLQWGALVAGVLGLDICGVMMIMGRRNRSQTAVEGATGIPWVVGGLILIAAAPTLVATFLS